MRRLVPWLLLGVLGLVTGLGLGLGLAYGPSEGPEAVFPSLTNVVPSWLPPGFTQQPLSGDGRNGDCTARLYRTKGEPFSDVPRQLDEAFLRSYAKADGSQGLAYITSHCPWAMDKTGWTQVDGHQVDFGSEARGVVWATWEPYPRIFVLASAHNLPRAELERFIAGLRVAYPSYLHHH